MCEKPLPMPAEETVPRCETEKVVLPQIVSVKKASEMMNLPPYYLRKLCREVPGLAFQSGVKWYINLGKLAAYYSGEEP